MKALLIVVAFSAAQAWGQTADQRGASDAESRAVAYIVDCMVAGLPEDWKRAVMEINLDKPYDETGGVRYVFARDEDTRPAEPFQPCDFKRPAKTLIELRETLAPEKRGWVGAQLTILRDGRFGIRYGYPKRNP